MKLKEFIKQNRKQIDQITQSPIKNDQERRLFILNDESLYNWAKTSGVKL
jgi:hypothetical protein